MGERRVTVQLEAQAPRLDVQFHTPRRGHRHQEALELVTQELSITTFRYVPRELRAAVGTDTGEPEIAALNRSILDRLQQGGDAFVSHAVVGGRFVLRACIVNFHTTLGDVEATVDLVVRLGREAMATASV